MGLKTYYLSNPAICVFGVYTEDQTDNGRFWDALSKQLQNKGPDYVARCTFMNEPSDAGKNVIPPASFPRQFFQEIQEISPMAKVSEEDLKNVCE